MTNIISPFYQITLVTILLNIILAIGLNLVIGFSKYLRWGMPVLCKQSGYTAERWSVTKLKAFLSLLLGLFVGTIISVIALIVGIRTLVFERRLPGYRNLGYR